MAATMQDVASRVREVLSDPGKTRWTDAALFYWASDALDMLCHFAPQMFTKRGSHTTTAGALQTLTVARAVAIVDVIGLTPLDVAALTAFAPAWQSGSVGAAQQWSAAQDGPKSFVIYPPQAVSQTLTVDYVEAPAEITALTDTLPVSDDFVGPLTDYVIGMAEAKDANHVSSGRAQVFMQSFASKLGVKPQA